MSQDIPSRSQESRAKHTRRSVLRAGIGGASIALLSKSSRGKKSNPTNEERAATTRRMAAKLREKADDRSPLEDLLNKRSDKMYKIEHKFSKDHSGSGISTDHWRQTTFDNRLYMTYYTDACKSDPYANAWYDIYMDTTEGGGEGGPDQISFSWNDDHFRYNEGTADYDSNMDNLSVYDEEFNGVDFEWEDGYACGTYCGGSKDFWVSCDAELLATNQERAIQAEYHDMWNSATVNGFSVGSGGSVGFNFSSTGEWDEYGRKVVEGNEAESGCGI